MASAPEPTLNSLQVGRAVAALAVVWYHAELEVSGAVTGNELPRAVSAMLSHGFLGVDFFFVLSGFIIYHVNVDRTSKRFWPSSYFQSRASRIYIPYLPVGIAIALIYTALPGLSASGRDWDWGSTLTLLPTGGPPALNVAWTLQHEIIFYSIAFVLLRTGRLLAGSALWAAMIVLFWSLGITGVPGLSVIDLEFMFGILAAWRFRRGINMGWLRALALAAGLFGAAFYLGPLEYRVLVGCAFAVLLEPIVALERTDALRFGAFALLLGEASYAIYLVHPPAISVLVRLLPDVNVWAALVAVAAMAAAAGLVYHLGFERPALRFVRQRLRARRQRKLAGEAQTPRQ